MANYFIKHADFEPFVSAMVAAKKVIAPKAKQDKFIFSEIKSYGELRLDYDVTLLPPKKEFFPTCQHLVTFDKDGFKGTINPENKVLFGVHFYDIKGIDMTDFLFRQKNEDWNYLAYREATTIIGSSVQTVADRAFWGTVGSESTPQGHDGFITKLDDGYVYEVRTDKGKALLEFGKFAEANSDQVAAAEKYNKEIMDKCPQKLKYSSREIAEKVRNAFNNRELWFELSEKCFSCGSCNTTCPTCYCFDVQDLWNVDQVSGTRTRYWDACLTEDFAKVSLGGGKEENFRDSRADRFRHRVMRKSAYLNETLGTPACTGCGRCATQCTADIADPVRVINRIMEE